MGHLKQQTWSEAKEDFEKILKNAHAVGLFAKNATKSGKERLKELEELEKAKLFLSNLEELKSFFPEKDEKTFAELLNKASLALRYPDKTKNRADFLKACQDLAPLLDAIRPEVKQACDNYSAGFLFGILTTMAGGTAAAVVIAMLAGGPWGLAALAVAFVVCGLVTAAAKYNIARNKKFLNDEQYNFISTFAEDLVAETPDDEKNPGENLGLSAS